MPVFNDTWVSLMVTETLEGSDYVYDLYAANKLYTGNDGSQIGLVLILMEVKLTNPLQVHSKKLDIIV